MVRESEEGNVRIRRIFKRSSRREENRWEKISKRRKKSTNLRLLAHVCRKEGATALAGDGLNGLPGDPSSPNYSGILWFCETTTNPSVQNTPCLTVSRLRKVLKPPS